MTDQPRLAAARLTLLVSLLGAAPGCLGPPALEERHAVLDRRFSLAVGAQLLSDFDSEIRLDSDSGRGTTIDLEDGLGVESSVQVLRVDADWRISPRHGLNFSFFEIDRQGTRRIDEEIRFGDVVFPIDAKLDTDTKIGVLKLAYRYFFSVGERHEIAASFGFHTMDMNFELASGLLDREEDADAVAPLPVVGVTGAYALGQRTRVMAIGEFFALEFDDFDGYLGDIRVTLDHDLSKHFGVGIGYNRFDLDVDLEASDFSGAVDWGYNGLMLYLRGLW